MKFTYVNILFLSFYLLGFSHLHSDTCAAGFTDQHIQKAINLVNSNGGGIVFLRDGNYELRNAIYLKDNVQLVGQSKNTVLTKCPLFSSPIIKDVSIGDKRVYIEDTSLFQVGDGVSFFSHSIAAGQVWVTEIVEILPQSLLVKDPAQHHLTLSSKPIIYCSFPCIFCEDCNNVLIRNLTVDGNMQENPVIDSWWDSGIGVKDSSYVEILNLLVKNAAGDGISLNTAHHVTINEITIDSSARLGIHIGSGSLYTYMGNSKVLNSGLANFVNTDGLYLCYSAAFGYYENNIIQNTRRAGLSIGRWDSGNIFYNNLISNNVIGLLFRTDTFETANIVFLKNQIYNNSLWDIQADKPIHNIFFDCKPSSSSFHPASSNLFHYDERSNTWTRFQ